MQRGEICLAVCTPVPASTLSKLTVKSLYLPGVAGTFQVLLGTHALDSALVGAQAACRSDPRIARSHRRLRPRASGRARGSSGPVQPPPDSTEKSHWAQPHVSVCKSALVASSHGGTRVAVAEALVDGKAENRLCPSRQSRWTPPENAGPQRPPGTPARWPAVLDG